MNTKTGADLIKTISIKFKISKTALEKHKNYYNNHFDEYDNKIYRDTKTRIVHLINFSGKNWFNKRYDMLFKKYSSFDCIIEVGFGLPYLLLTAKKDKQKMPSLIYVDKYASALTISKEIINNTKEKVELIKGDIEKEKIWKKLKSKTTSKTLLVGIEILEHLKSPDNFWKNAKILNPSKVIISLPIGPKIPSHFLTFKTENDVRNYLKKHMVIEDEEVISPITKSGDNIDKYKDFIAFGVLK